VPQEWLRHTTGGDEAWEGIATSMRDIARQALMCAQGEVQNRKGSCELFGFDFCFDDAYKVWLIEINCSPSLEHSTPITSRLVTNVLEDAAKVLVDLPEQKVTIRDSLRRTNMIKPTTLVALNSLRTFAVDHHEHVLSLAHAVSGPRERPAALTARGGRRRRGARRVRASCRKSRRTRADGNASIAAPRTFRVR
jgi:hypothetical protein